VPAALKLKEISYIHVEGYAAGELKHGPIALIDETMPVVVIAPYDRVFDKTLSNIKIFTVFACRVAARSSALRLSMIQQQERSGAFTPSQFANGSAAMVASAQQRFISPGESFLPCIAADVADIAPDLSLGIMPTTLMQQLRARQQVVRPPPTKSDVDALSTEPFSVTGELVVACKKAKLIWVTSATSPSMCLYQFLSQTQL
jgi:SIS domain